MLENAHVGDMVLIDNKTDNIVVPAGSYEAKIVAEDDAGIAVESHSGCSYWWFYRDSGESYVGDAIASLKS